MDAFAEKMNFGDLDCWYHVTGEDLINSGMSAVWKMEGKKEEAKEGRGSQEGRGKEDEKI